MEVLWILLAAVVVFIGGYAAGYYGARPKPVGNLRVDRSDSDGPYLFLEFESNPGDISQLEYVTFKVDVRNYISHK